MKGNRAIRRRARAAVSDRVRAALIAGSVRALTEKGANVVDARLQIRTGLIVSAFAAHPDHLPRIREALLAARAFTGGILFVFERDQVQDLHFHRAR